MGAELFLVRLLLTLPAAIGALLLFGLLAAVLRLREPRVRSGLLLFLAADCLLVPFGASGTTFLFVSLSAAPARLHEIAGPFAVPALAAWLAVAAGLAIRRVRRRRRLAGGLESLARLLPAPAALLAEVADAAAASGVRTPLVFVDPEERGPFVAGRVLVLPAAAFAALDPEGRRAALLHEMAHLRRRDGLRAAAIGHLSDLFWFNPALAALLRGWGRECEGLTDRLALRLGATVRGLARGLACLRPGMPPAPAAATALGVETSRSLLRRVRLLAAPPRRRVLVVQVLLLGMGYMAGTAIEDVVKATYVIRFTPIEEPGFRQSNGILVPAGTNAGDTSSQTIELIIEMEFKQHSPEVDNGPSGYPLNRRRCGPCVATADWLEVAPGLVGVRAPPEAGAASGEAGDSRSGPRTGQARDRPRVGATERRPCRGCAISGD